MKRRWTIDTNVPVVANGRDDRERPIAPQCREATIAFLLRFIENKECAVIDAAGEIEREYRRYLRPAGQPGVGDRFYLELISNPSRCERIHLPRREDGEYADLPQAVVDSGFDSDDRKFAALARRERIPVANAVDSDWLDARELLRGNGIRVKFLCGCEIGNWFAA